MAVLASLKGARWPRSSARPRLARPPSRLAVLTWTLAVVALGGAVASSLFGPDYGVSALVTTAPASASAHVEPETEPKAALLDPNEFRRPAPPADGRPRVAIIVRGLGLSRSATAKAILDLPADVTFALSAYGRDLQKDADTARADGHEVFLDVPVEPQGYPANDAGPEAILTSLTSSENAGRLEWALTRFIGFPGLVFAPASPALDSKETLAPLFEDAALNGLVWAHTGAKGFDGAKIEMATAEMSIDQNASADEVDAALGRLEGIAREGGTALAIVSSAPTTMARLKAWTAALEDKGIVLVPASAVAVKPGA
jgi:polysaccharide deacetylase 2 family uncharacterized protein YibQ